jgi:hypothetical protein
MQVTLAEAVASCVTLNMTLLAPEDLSTLPLYFNLLQSKFYTPIVPIHPRSYLNFCRHHQEQRLDRGK